MNRPKNIIHVFLILFAVLLALGVATGGYSLVTARQASTIAQSTATATLYVSIARDGTAYPSTVFRSQNPKNLLEEDLESFGKNLKSYRTHEVQNGSQQTKIWAMEDSLGSIRIEIIRDDREPDYVDFIVDTEIQVDLFIIKQAELYGLVMDTERLILPSGLHTFRIQNRELPDFDTFETLTPAP